jgi:hypothetical protein
LFILSARGNPETSQLVRITIKKKKEKKKKKKKEVVLDG